MFRKSVQHIILCLLAVVQAARCHIKMKRELTKDGFHRDIETTLLLPERFVTECQNSSVLIFETLPPGVYMDPFQIKSLEEFGGPQVFFGHPVNIEAPEFVSNPLELFIFLNISTIPSTVSDSYVKTSIVLPVHGRYHEPSDEDTHAAANILHPGLYTNCSGGGLTDGHTLSAPCDRSGTHQCVWTHMPFESESSHLIMHLPVGQRKHKALVISVTLLVSVFVSVFLTKVVFSYKEKSRSKVS